jgi:hypothetical protein
MDVAVDRQRSGKDWLSEIDSWSREVIFLHLPWVARHLGGKPALIPFQQALPHISSSNGLPCRDVDISSIS